MEESFETWKHRIKASIPPDQRLGQWLYNQAPKHIRNATNGSIHLDPFHVNPRTKQYVINNFLMLAELIWDVEDPKEIEDAKKLVLSEIYKNAESNPTR